VALTLRTTRWLYRLASLALLAGSAAFGWMAVTVSIAPPREQATSPTRTAPQPSLDVNLAQRVDPKHPAWRLPLRRPLYDPPPPPPPQVVVKQLPPLQAKLLGTILEPGASRAMIELPGGAVEFRAEGEPLGPQDPGAIVEAIEPDRVRIARGDEKTELTIERGY
jgi:hypothetical protein